MKDYEPIRKKLLKQLWTIAHNKGISHQTMADRSGFQQGHVTRALQGRYSLTLDNLLRLAEAAECRIEIKEK